MADVRRAFEMRLRRRAAAHPELYPQFSNNNHNRKAVNANMARLLDILRDKPFWIWDGQEHKEGRNRAGEIPTAAFEEKLLLSKNTEEEKEKTTLRLYRLTLVYHSNTSRGYFLS